MVQKQPKRSEREWIDLIRECRASGLSDKAWCEEHGISASTFYHRIKRLKKKACEIPGHSGKTLQPPQQAVPLAIVDIPEETPQGFPIPRADDAMFAGTPAIALSYKGIRLEINNHADTGAMQNAVYVLRQLC